MAARSTVLAFTAFGATTYALVEHDVIAPFEVTAPGSRVATLDESIALYVWHFFDTIPLVSINETLHWREPVPDYGSSAGEIILVFKVLVLFSVTAALVRIVRRKAEPADEEGSDTSVESDREGSDTSVESDR